jgi:cytochrome c1
MFRLGRIFALLAAVTLTGCGRSDADVGAKRGAALIAQYGCGACHTIPGIAGATGRVGPSLASIGNQAIIAGMLANTRDNLVTWIRTPQTVVPGNAMPNTELNDHDVRDIASYLYTLR